MEHLTDQNPDVIFLTETWLTSEKNNITAEIREYGIVPYIRSGRTEKRIEAEE